jgi:ATP-dependent exoDNAse (exonuclease V) beta subunit
LDVSRSFIVQAPAGSGKTELLIQRYLALLQTVERPEQVIAITFTRKAAAEMRSRVMQALRDAAAAPITVADGHRAVTLSIARAVIARDRQLQWFLPSHPERVRIDTLDALNGWLARQLPVLSGGVAGAEVVEHAVLLYREAARKTVDRLHEGGDLGASLRSLLAAVDNSVERLEGLLAMLLPSRDQWLRHLLGTDGDALIARLTSGLTGLASRHIHRLNALLTPAQRTELSELSKHGARHAASTATREALAVWGRGADLSGDGAESLPAWRGIAHLLLIGSGEWRRRLTKNEGFGPEHPQPRRTLSELLDALRPNDELRAALATLQQLPDTEYSPDQCRDLLALRRVLPHAVAELRVTFAERNAVDFVELAIAAEQALGSVDEPSELLLAIDRRLQHILVDEFQDTSHAQLRLLELLTAGWLPGDGRTLFLVGDPMQSIYRFRDADMSLFLRAKHRGVGQVKPELLVLEKNFRSAPAVVRWTNDVFAGVFAERDDPDAGIARFYPCIAARAVEEGAAIRVHGLRSDDPDAEIRQTIDLLEREQETRPGESIAVLVQSRAHLLGLQAALRSRGLNARAVEIESLAETEVGQDLIGLCRALSHLGDRLAWLAVLRAPWCGLGWSDLHALCADAGNRTVWELLHDAQRIAMLGSDGQARARAVAAILARAREERAQYGFAGWIEHTWRLLGGPACLVRAEDRDRADQFFAALPKFARHGDLDDPAELERHFLEPRRQADPGDEGGIEIMTIHRAKGLEFDTVILLGLAKRVRGPELRALHWQERWNDDGTTALLLAPLARDKNRLSAYLQQAEQQRDLAERGRLLYVAATRARRRLHLVARLGAGQDIPLRGTLLDLLWTKVAAEFDAAGALDPAAPRTEPAAVQPRLFRFAEGFDPPNDAATDTIERAARKAREGRPEFEWAGQTAVQVGTVVHRQLQAIGETGLDTWTPTAIDAGLSARRRELEMLGVAPRELDEAARRVIAALRRVIADPRGRWILAPHAEAASELRLTVDNGRSLDHLQLDRTFVDEGDMRWIIDYKTSSHEGGQIATFIDSEVARYEAQLERYAEAMAAIDPRPIRVALYFPLLAEFRDWAPKATFALTAN